MEDSASMGTSLHTHQGSLNSEEITKRSIHEVSKRFYERKFFYRPLPLIFTYPQPSNLDCRKDVFYVSVHLTNLRRRFKTKIIIMAK